MVRRMAFAATWLGAAVLAGCRAGPDPAPAARVLPPGQAAGAQPHRAGADPPDWLK